MSKDRILTHVESHFKKSWPGLPRESETEVNFGLGSLCVDYSSLSKGWTNSHFCHFSQPFNLLCMNNLQLKFCYKHSPGRISSICVWWWDLGTVAIVGKVREIWGRSEGLISVLSSYSRLKSLHLLQFINDQKNAFCVFNNWNWNESSSVLYSWRHCRMQDMHTKGQGYSPSLPVTNQMTLVGLHLSEP